MSDEKKTRSIDELADLPYSEMTEDEIAMMVEFRASVIARDENHMQRMEENRQHMEEIAEIHRKAAQKAIDRLEDLKERARKRYDEIDKEGR